MFRFVSIERMFQGPVTTGKRRGKGSQPDRLDEYAMDGLTNILGVDIRHGPEVMETRR